MGFLERLSRMIRANFNSLINEAEDPEKILEQAVMEMQDNLILMRQAVAQAIASQKRTERQYTQIQSQAEEWYRRAQLAIPKGEDNLAREALTKRKYYQETAQTLQEQIAQQNLITAKLKQDIKALEGKMVEAKTKKDTYIVRARSAQASQRLNEMLGNINTGSTLSAFERMEEKVIKLEAQAEVSASLETGDLEKKFAALTHFEDIDSELLALKAQILTGND